MIRQMHRHRILQSLSLLFVIFTVGCASTGKLSTKGKQTLYADEAVHQLGAMQNIAFAACDSNELPIADCNKVATYTLATVETLRTVPNGWQATVAKAFIQFPSTLSAATQTKIASYLALVKTALIALGVPLT